MSAAAIDLARRIRDTLELFLAAHPDAADLAVTFDIAERVEGDAGTGVFDVTLDGETFEIVVRRAGQ
jgi:hypothetical protein